MKNSSVFPETFAIFALWAPMFIFGVFILLLSFFGAQTIEWLFDTYTPKDASRIVLVFFGVYSGWLVLNSIWFVVLGLKTISLGEYPPDNLPIPLNSRRLRGGEAKKAGAILVLIAIFSFMLGAVFAYGEYISSSSGL